MSRLERTQRNEDETLLPWKCGGRETQYAMSKHKIPAYRTLKYSEFIEMKTE